MDISEAEAFAASWKEKSEAANAELLAAVIALGSPESDHILDLMKTDVNAATRMILAGTYLDLLRHDKELVLSSLEQQIRRLASGWNPA